MSFILIIEVPKVVLGTWLAVNQILLLSFGNMLGAENKIVSNTNAVLAHKKLSVKWKVHTK